MSDPRSPAGFAMTDLRGSRDVLVAMRKQVRTWTTPEQMPAVLELLAHCCTDADDQKLLDEYADYLRRLDRAARFEGRTVGEWLDQARRDDPRLAKLLDRRP